MLDPECPSISPEEKCARASRISARKAADPAEPGPTTVLVAGSLTAFASKTIAGGGGGLCRRGRDRRARAPVTIGHRNRRRRTSPLDRTVIGRGTFQEECRARAGEIGSAIRTSRSGAGPMWLKG